MDFAHAQYSLLKLFAALTASPLDVVRMMRLTEEVVELLKKLQQKSDLSATSDEAIEEAEHEGLIVGNGNNIFSLTTLGLETLIQIQRRLISADQLKLSEQAKIAYISQRNYPRFQKLSSFGLSSGVPVKIQQKFPSFVLQCEETQVALEEEILRDIFVWRD